SCEHPLLAVALIVEPAWLSEDHPSAILAILHSLRRTAQGLITWDVYGRPESQWNNECLDVHDVVGAQVFASMHAKGLLLEGLSRGVHFHSTASVSHGQRALFYDCKNTTRMVMPGEHFPIRYGELPRRYDGRTADQF